MQQVRKFAVRLRFAHFDFRFGVHGERLARRKLLRERMARQRGPVGRPGRQFRQGGLADEPPFGLQAAVEKGVAQDLEIGSTEARCRQLQELAAGRIQGIQFVHPAVVAGEEQAALRIPLQLFDADGF